MEFKYHLKCRYVKTTSEAHCPLFSEPMVFLELPLSILSLKENTVLLIVVLILNSYVIFGKFFNFSCPTVLICKMGKVVAGIK